MTHSSRFSTKGLVKFKGVKPISLLNTFLSYDQNFEIFSKSEDEKFYKLKNNKSGVIIDFNVEEIHESIQENFEKMRSLLVKQYCRKRLEFNFLEFSNLIKCVVGISASLGLLKVAYIAHIFKEKFSEKIISSENLEEETIQFLSNSYNYLTTAFIGAVSKKFPFSEKENYVNLERIKNFKL